MTITAEPVKQDVRHEDEVPYRNMLMRQFNKSFPHPNPNGLVHRTPAYTGWERDWEFTFHAFTWIIAKVAIDADEVKEMWHQVRNNYRGAFIDWMGEFVQHGELNPSMVERFNQLTA